MRHAIVLLVAACALVPPRPAAAEDDAAEPVLTNRLTRTLRVDVPDLASVASVKFFLTQDAGATWTLLQQFDLPAGATEAPRLPFTAPADGTYGFATSVSYLDRHSEPEPRPGTPPIFSLTVDSTAPTGSFQVRLEALVGGNANLRLSWTARDRHLGGDAVRFEASSDGGATFAPFASGRAEGTVLAPAPVAPGAARLTVRMLATDRAGNQLVSPVQHLELAPAPGVAAAPPASDGDLAQALRALPVIKPDEHARAATRDPAAPRRPDIVMPDRPAAAAAPAAGPAASADGAVLQGGDEIEREYQRRLAERSGTGPDPAWMNRARPRSQISEEPIAAADAPATVAGAPPAAPARPRAFLAGAQAAAVLDNARAAARRNDLALALDLYAQLHASTLAGSAVPEELKLMRVAGRPRDGLAVIATLPPEALTDAVRIEHGRALIALGRHQEAMPVLLKIGRGSPLAQESLYLVAGCLHHLGRPADARKVLTMVAASGGEYGLAAQEDLVRLRDNAPAGAPAP